MTRRIAVYGSLKKGFWNYDRFLKDAQFEGEDTVEGTLVLPKGLPYPHFYLGDDLFDGAHKQMHPVEVYQVEEDVFKVIDGMEAGAGYAGANISTQFGPARIFVMRADAFREGDEVLPEYTREELSRRGIIG